MSSADPQSQGPKRPPSRGWPAAVLSIAGVDPCGSAGLAADLRTFAARGVAGAPVVACLTVQDSVAVSEVVPMPPDLVVRQAEAVLADLPIRAVKTGLLADPGIIEAVARLLALSDRPLVVDPVLASGTGQPMGREGQVGAYRRFLLPMAVLVTPNLPELARLVGAPVEEAKSWDMARREEAARVLLETGVGAVLVKAGHSAADRDSGVASDLLVLPAGQRHVFQAAWIDTPHDRGTGCTLSAAITASLALGSPLAEAVAAAHRFLNASLLHARSLGRGRGGPHQLHELDDRERR